MKFEAILFDCDGVLVDSEPLTNQVLREMLAEAGWSMTQAECMAYFVGKTVREERAVIEARTGQPLDAGLAEPLLPAAQPGPHGRFGGDPGGHGGGAGGA